MLKPVRERKKGFASEDKGAGNPEKAFGNKDKGRGVTRACKHD